MFDSAAMILSILASTAPLAAEYLKTRKENGEAVSNEDFQRWLQDEMMPQLLAQSDHLLRTMVSMKASQHERFQEVLDRIADIYRLLKPSTAADRWRELTDLDRQLLSLLLEGIRDREEEDLDIKDAIESTGSTSVEIQRSCRLLEENCWIHIHEFTGALFFSMRPAGVVFAWDAISQDEFQSTLSSLKRELETVELPVRAQELIEVTKAPRHLIFALLECWEGEGKLRLVKYDGGEENWLIHSIAESFRHDLTTGRS